MLDVERLEFPSVLGVECWNFLAVSFTVEDPLLGRQP
jgi:hypothetical protein